MSRMRIWPAVVVAAALLLSGCTVVTAPEPGFTDAERAEMKHRLTDLRWRWTLLPDELRPADPPTQVIDSSEWAAFIVDCMKDAGFDNYQEMDGGLMIDTSVLTFDEMNANDVAYFVCENSIEISDSGDFAFNQKQIDYIYDYYKQFLLPCLALHEVEVFDVPSKKDFDAGLGSWSPYLSVTLKTRPILTDDDTLFDECPPMPPGMPDYGLAEMYGH